MRRLFDISLQHSRHFLQLPSSSLGRRIGGKTRFQMIENDLFRERLHGLARRHQLVEHLAAIIVTLDQRLDPFELPGNFPAADLQGSAVAIGFGSAM